MTVIPFVSGISSTDTEQWIAVLSAQLPGFNIERFADLAAADRKTAQVAIVANPDPAELASLPELKWVQSLWAGVERLVAELPDDRIHIVRLADPQMADTMAEAVLAWTLYLHRDMPRYRAQQEAKTWLGHTLPLPSERTVGLLGLGFLGRRSAEVLKYHGFSICGWSRSQAQIEGVESYSGKEGIQTLLRRTNILVCLLPLTSETQGLLNEQTLAVLPKGAAVINFSRGSILHIKALTGLLDSGHLSHAVLDVFDEEPLPPESPLWTHPRITVLPHIAAPTNIRTASAIAARNISEFIETGEMPEGIERKRGY